MHFSQAPDIILKIIYPAGQKKWNFWKWVRLFNCSGMGATNLTSRGPTNFRSLTITLDWFKMIPWMQCQKKLLLITVQTNRHNDHGLGMIGQTGGSFLSSRFKCKSDRSTHAPTQLWIWQSNLVMVYGHWWVCNYGLHSMHITEKPVAKFFMRSGTEWTDIYSLIFMDFLEYD